MLKKVSAIWIIICIFVLCLSLSGVSSVRGDMGPKPSVTIKLQNMPEQRFVIALLTKDDEYGDKKNSLKEEADDPYASMNRIIYDFDEDGWKLALGPGSNPFMVGSDHEGLTKSCSGGKARFSYYAPSNFKVMLVTEDGSQYISNEITTTRFSAECIYDFVTGELVENTAAYREHDKQDYFGMAMVYLVGTLMVEGLVLIFFGLGQVRNLPVFFIANFLTQAYMHLDGWLYEIHNGSGGMAGTIHYILKEILIILVECLLYALFMKREKGKKIRIILYAIIANIVSAVTSSYVGGPLGSRILFWGLMIIVYIVVLIICFRNVKREGRLL